jgi:kynurenine formamidase
MPDRRIIDLSHVVEDGMITYRGLPAPVICDYLSREASKRVYAEGTEFHIGRIDMVANTGTYIDSPFHRYAHGRDIAGLRLETLVDMECAVIDAQSANVINPALFENIEIEGKAVLFRTGWDRHWRTDQYFEGHPHLTAESANELVRRGAALAGIDSFNIDSIADGTRPVHTILLGTDIPIVEHLCNLGNVPTLGARFNAAPVAVRGMGTFPVRAFASVETTT